MRQVIQLSNEFEMANKRYQQAFSKVFSSLVLLAIVDQVSHCSAARNVQFQLANDPNFPQLITVSNIQYNLVWGRYLDVSFTLAIYEDIDEGTSVSFFFFF